jgi:hypothetical protein
MERVKVYYIDSPLFYDVSDADRSQTKLVEIRLVDGDKLIRQDVMGDEDELVSSEIFKYDEAGKLLSSEVFVDGGKELFRQSFYQYTESGEIKRAIVRFDDQVTSEVLNFYNSSNQLIKSIERNEGQPEKIITYDWHSTIPECCIREETLTGGALQEIITREWKLEKGKGELVEERIEKPGREDALRVIRYYDGKEMENGVCVEVYDANGDFVEETREEYDSKGRVIRMHKHGDDVVDSTPSEQHVYEYDDNDNIIFHQSSVPGRIIFTIKNLYDSKKRLIRYLISDITTSVFFYDYEEC